jgi:hypothetical protein
MSADVPLLETVEPGVPSVAFRDQLLGGNISWSCEFGSADSVHNREVDLRHFHAKIFYIFLTLNRLHMCSPFVLSGARSITDFRVSVMLVLLMRDLRSISWDGIKWHILPIFFKAGKSVHTIWSISFRNERDCNVGIIDGWFTKYLMKWHNIPVTFLGW